MDTNTTEMINQTLSHGYIKRNKLDDDIKQFEKNLYSDEGKQLSRRPFLFLVYGLRGVGKHRFLDELINQVQDFKEPTNKSTSKTKKPIFIRLSLNQVDLSKEPLKIMEHVYGELLEDKAYRSLSAFEKANHAFNPDSHKHEDEFSKRLNEYKSTINRLKTEGIDKRTPVSGQQRENVEKLVKWSGQIIGTAAMVTVHPIAGLMVPSITEGIVPLAETVLSVTEELKNIKDDILNKHDATRQNEKLQALILNPLGELTPLFVNMLIEKAKRQPIVLILEKYEKVLMGDCQYPPLDDWVCRFFLSPANELFKNKSHQVRVIISSRNSLLAEKKWCLLRQEEYREFLKEVEIKWVVLKM